MKVVVIGVGNRMRRDDGVGLSVVERARERLPAEVRIETLGGALSLMSAWEGADLAVVVDGAAATELEPGRVVRLDVGQDPNAGLPAVTRNSGSSHGMGLTEAVGLSRVLGRLPRRLVILAIGVGDLGHGFGLSSKVDAGAGVAATHITLEVTRFLAARR